MIVGVDSGPLSPSSYLNPSIWSTDEGNDDGNSIDLFRYYLDLQNSQSKDFAPSNGPVANGTTPTTIGSGLSTPAANSNPTTTMNGISMADIDTWNALLLANSGVSGLSSSISPASTVSTTTNSNNMFPFADAASQQQQPIPAAFPPSAFSAMPNPGVQQQSPTGSVSTAGSEVPMDPRALFANMFGYPPSDLFSSNNAMPNVAAPPTIAPPEIVAKVEPTGEDEELAMLSASSTKKRSPGAMETTTRRTSGGRNASQRLESVEEEETEDNDATMYHSDDDSEEDEEEDDDGDAAYGASGTRKRSSGTSQPASKARKVSSSGSSSRTKVAAPATAASKKSASVTPTAASAHNQAHPHALIPVPEWEDRPSKEVYDKLSSKEKRQLRNKISARNFRHRRKAHIDTLEGELGEKNRTISVLREEVGTLRSENQGLRADIELLKKNWESIAAKISAASVAAPPASAPLAASSVNSLTPEEDDLYGESLPALSPPSSSASTNGDNESLLLESLPTASDRPSTSASTSTTATTANKRVTRSTRQVNTRKDLSGSGTAFWEGGSRISAFGGPRFMDVHTTFVPEISLSQPLSPINGETSPLSLISEKGRSKDSLGAYFAAQMQQEANKPNLNRFAYGGNMNPALNGLTQDQINRLRDSLVSTAAGNSSNASSVSSPNAAATSPSASVHSSSSGHSTAERDPIRDGFFDVNTTLSLRSDKLQDYRGQLYSKLAHNFAGIHAAQVASRSGAPVPEGFRPAFFSKSPKEEETNNISALHQKDIHHPAAVKAAGTIVTKTLFEKLSGAFWDAFTGDQPPQSARAVFNGSSPAPKNVDYSKVADVIGGRSRLTVVPNTPTEDKSASSIDSVLGKLDKLELKDKH